MAALANLAIMAGIGLSLLPHPEFSQQALASLATPSAGSAPWLLLALSSATASLLLIKASQDQASPVARVSADGASGPAATPTGFGSPIVPAQIPVEAPVQAAGFCSLGPTVTQTVSGNGDIGVHGLMARIGHELRTPLTAIIGFSDIMQQELHGPLGSDRYQSYAGHIRESGVTLLLAIEDALAVAERLNVEARQSSVQADLQAYAVNARFAEKAVS